MPSEDVVKKLIVKGLPDFRGYWRSLQAELDATKDRIRCLVRHWPTDGAFKEAALRCILRRHLPESMNVCRGFVVAEERSSTEIDILLVDRTKPTLFKDGDLVIVTPDAVQAIIEVKSSLVSIAEIADAIAKISANRQLCAPSNQRRVWTGLFVYNGEAHRDERLLRSVAEAYARTHTPIDCIAYGPDTVVRFCELPPPDDSFWMTWHIRSLAATLFIADILSATSDRPDETSSRMQLPKEADNRFWILTKGDSDPYESYIVFGGDDLQEGEADGQNEFDRSQKEFDW